MLHFPRRLGRRSRLLVKKFFHFCICQKNICLSKPQQFWKQRQLGSWPSNSRTTMAVPQRFAQLPSTTAPLRQRAALRDTVARLARTPRGPLRLRSGRAARFLMESELSYSFGGLPSGRGKAAKPQNISISLSTEGLSASNDTLLCTSAVETLVMRRAMP